MRVCVLTAQDPGGGFTVISPTLPGCVTQGDTLPEALTRHRRNVRQHLWSDLGYQPRKLSLSVVGPRSA